MSFDFIVIIFTKIENHLLKPLTKTAKRKKNTFFYNDICNERISMIFLKLLLNSVLIFIGATAFFCREKFKE